MIDTATVFVLGAGASAEYGFPTGVELRNQILALHHDENCMKLLAELFFDETVLNKFFEDFRKSTQPSIDSFLEKNAGLENIGKTMICYILGQFEKKSILECYEGGSILSSHSRWYSALWSSLTRGTGSDSDFFDVQFESKNGRVKFVSFNYDRSLEYFLLLSAIHSYHYSLSDEKDAAYFKYGMRQLWKENVIHLYGQSGLMDWQIPMNQRNSVPEINGHREYGAIDWGSAHSSANQITVLHEKTSTSPEFNKAKAWINEAKHIYFLGFGFLEENVSRLGLRQLTNKRVRYAVKSKSQVPERIKLIFSKNKDTIGVNLSKHDMNLKDFLDEYALN